MKHLTPDALLEAVEGTLTRDDAAHLCECVACDTRVGELRAALRDVRTVAVPEPSPLFWERFSARVGAAIDQETVPQTRLAPRWFGLPVLVPLGALALIVMTLASAMPARPPRVALVVPTAPARASGSESAATDTSGDTGWVVLSELVSSLGVDVGPEAGIALNPGDAERAAANLSAAEQQELLRLLKAEIDRAGG